MKNKQQVKHNSILIRCLMIVALLSVTLCVSVIFGFANLHFFRLFVNRKQWVSSGPSAYYMQVTEAHSDGGFWQWAVYVEESNPITVTVLKTGEYPNRKSGLDPTNLTIEQIFSLADRSCANRGILDCELEFDPQFHYPKRIFSYETIIIEINQFFPCESKADCVPESESSP